MSLQLSRRDVLAGVAAFAMPAPGLAENNGVSETLDAAAADPARGVVLIAGVTARTRVERLDLSAARAGLAIDAELAKGADGAQRYTLLLRRTLGNAVDADVAERRLRVELARLTRRADRLFGQIGQSLGSIGERYSTLWRDPRFLYSDSDAGRDAAVADMNRTLATERARVAASFGPVPGWCFEMSVRRLSSAEDAAGKGGYREAPAPGRSGAYIVDLRDIRRRPSWTLPGVVAHEMLPGHLLQAGIEQVVPPHSLRMKYAAAFSEGWAIYAESLATGGGVHVELGRLHWLLFRVGRALADIGIHLRGWSVEQAWAKLAEWQGEPAYFAPFEVELARIAREPATRAADALAWLAIADLAPAGSRVAFHQALLRDGRARIEDLPG